MTSTNRPTGTDGARGDTADRRDDERLLAMLDALAAADRAVPDAGFERRIAGATLPGRASVAGSIGPEGASLRSGPGGGLRGGLRLGLWAAVPLAAAASLLLVSGVLPFGGGRPPAPSPGAGNASLQLAQLEADIDDFLFIDALLSGASENEAPLGADAAFGDGAFGDGAGDDDAGQTADEFIFGVLSVEGGAT